jgi:hypothetical protein
MSDPTRAYDGLPIKWFPALPIAVLATILSLILDFDTRLALYFGVVIFLAIGSVHAMLKSRPRDEARNAARDD